MQQGDHAVAIGPMLDNEKAAAYMGISPDTLNKWRSRGEGPAATKMGRIVRYHVRELDKYIALNTKKTA